MKLLTQGLGPGSSSSGGTGGPGPTLAGVPATPLAQGDTTSQARGTVRRYRVTLVDPSTGQPPAGVFDGTGGVRAFVWAGGAGPALATPGCGWDDAAAGTLTLDLVAADLAGLECQPYPVRVEVQVDGQWQVGWDGWLEVLPEPGSDVAPVALGVAYADLVRLGGTAIKQLQTIESLAGFLRERADAWTWLRGVILARYRPPGGAYGGGAFYPTGLPGYWVSPDYPNPIIAGYLDAGHLLITPLVTEVLARKALGLLYDRQDDPKWAGMARREHLRADWGVASLVAGIDVNADGFPDVVVNCGVLNTRDI